MFNPIAMIRKRRMKTLQRQRPSFSYNSVACHIGLDLSSRQCQRQSNSYRLAVITAAVILCNFMSVLEAASVTPTAINNDNIRRVDRTNLRNSHFRVVRGIDSPPHSSSNSNNNNNYHFLDQQNEYDSSSSGVSILDDDTLKLSLAIDEDSVGGGLSAPSLHILEPKVYLRVSGESGMIKPDYQQPTVNSNNEVIIRESSIRYPNFRASPQNDKRKGEQGTDLQYKSNEEEHESFGGEEEDDEDDMSDNYHHHFPYIESYRERYVKPDFGHYVPYVVTTTPPPPTHQPTTITSKKEPSLSVSKSKQQEWSDIIAQVTTPSSFNEINSSASEHRLADFHIRANLPAYFYNKYSTYSEDDLENVADLDDEHSKYFVKTKPRSVTTTGSNIYSNFYYEPPSFSTKSVPIPVKTNKEKVVFASLKHTEDTQPLYSSTRIGGGGDETQELSSNNHKGGQIYHGDHDEEAQQDSPVMTTISSNFTSHIPTLTPQQMNYDREVEGAANHDDNNSNDNYSNESILKPSATSSATHSHIQQRENGNYYKNEQHHSSVSSKNNGNKSSAETLDVSTSQSVLSKLTVNNPHLSQLVIIKAEPLRSTLATPGHEIVTSSVESEKNDDYASYGDGNTSTEINPISEVTSSPSSSTTTDATSIPGIPGIDYPTLDEIPQTGFDCQKQRYKGFFADIDTKCQAWHYCDFTDGHSTFLCPNGTLFSQVLLTCDWWFNVDCNQARQLYVLNERLYRYIKPPKPSFPEDFIGEHVDKWLLQQFTDGFLPKVRKKGKAKLVNLPLPPPTSSPAAGESPAQRNDTDSDV